MKVSKTVSNAGLVIALATGGLGLASTASAADSGQSQSIDQMTQKHKVTNQDSNNGSVMNQGDDLHNGAKSAKMAHGSTSQVDVGHGRASKDDLNNGAKSAKMAHGSNSEPDVGNGKTSSDDLNNGMEAAKRAHGSTSPVDNSKSDDQDDLNNGMEAAKRKSHESSDDQ